MKSQIRMLSLHHRQLCELLDSTEKEQACFLLCAAAQGDGEMIFLVREVVPLLPEDLAVQRYDQLSVSPAALLRVARKAQAANYSVCMVHTHPMSRGAVAFSYADDIGNKSTFEFLHRFIPERPHSCLVWDGDIECCAGRLYESGKKWSVIDNVSVVNDANYRAFQSSSRALTAHDVSEEFERQARLLGRDGQVALNGRRIAIVGCGGIGSLVGPLLAHGGFRHFVLLDPDMVEKSNLLRLLGATPNDVSRKTLKVELVQRYINTCVPDACVIGCANVVEDPQVLKYLVSSDLIVCCTDDTTSRAYLNQLAQQYYVPVMDLGVQFVMDKSTGQLVKEVGKVNFVAPGYPCMICSNHINSKTLHDEGLTESEKRARGNYIDGLEEKEPSMMAFNMQVAGLAAQVITCWISGLMPVALDIYERFSFLGVAGKKGLHAVMKRANFECPVCGPSACLLGAGDAHSMWTRPRPREVA